MSSHHFRSSRGNVLILSVVFATLFLMPCTIVLSELFRLFIEKSVIQPQVDAAALTAASQLSRIVLNDPNFGYVSLSNYPPIGRQTMALDGEPLPVWGINTLEGTIRQLTIVGEELGSDTILSLAKSDHQKLDWTAFNLSHKLSDAVSLPAKGQFFDLDGTRMDIAVDVRKRLEKSLNGNFKIKEFKITTGWLNQGGRTTIRTGGRDFIARNKASRSRVDKELAPFVDVYTESDSFQFAGLGTSATLCSGEHFVKNDEKHICSIVHLECQLERSTSENVLFSILTNGMLTLQFSATAQPGVSPDLSAPGVMSVRFPGGMIPAVTSWADLLKKEMYSGGSVNHFNAVNGDYPTDQEASMTASSDIACGQVNGSNVFEECLYYWLRNGHGKATVDAVMSMIDRPFRFDGQSGFFIYEFEKNGLISTRSIQQDPFPLGVVADQQSETFVDTNIASSGQCFITLRNEVKNLGNISGGKHGGQPLSGYPLDWCERAEFQGSVELADSMGKGTQGTNLSLLGDTFYKANGQKLHMQPRKTFYSGGLATDIEMSIRQLKFK